MSSSKFLNTYIVTYNCGRTLLNSTAFAPHLLDAFTPQPGKQASIAKASFGVTLPELIVLNLQEIAPIAHGFLGGSFLTPYFDQFRRAVSLVARQSQADSDQGSKDDGGEDELKYVNILTRNVGLTAIMIFIRSDLVGRVADIMSGGVGVGWQEMGNKGAVAARMTWKLDDQAIVNDNDDDDQAERSDTTTDRMDVTFISAHLAPAEDNLERRNKDYTDIARGLVFTSDLKSSRSSSTSKPLANELPNDAEEDAPLLQGTPSSIMDNDHTTIPSSNPGIYSPTTHTFLSGDLNYRTSALAPTKLDQKSFPQPNSPAQSSTHWSQLLPHDQLLTALKQDQTLQGLTESPITFAPTYKYKLPDSNSESASDSETKQVYQDTDFTTTYPWATHRWPSWCDRILYSLPPQGSPPLILKKYTSLPLFRTSDHRPVALHVQIPLAPVFNPTIETRKPIDIDLQGWKGRRDAARGKEIVVGVLAYLVLTWEGRVVLVAGLGVVVGGVFMTRAMA